MAHTVDDAVVALESLYPLDLAESWDSPGLSVGDPDFPVQRILFAVDVAPAVIDEAIEWDADLIVTHHPLFFRPVHSVAATDIQGHIIQTLLEHDCALYSAHTNADKAERGVSQALADLLGLTGTRPLVPDDGAVGEATGLGRIGALDGTISLGDLARRVVERTPQTVSGVLVSGPKEAEVGTVAVLGGSGGSLLEQAERSGADAIVTSDLRHHDVLDLRSDAEFERGQDGTPFVIELAHFAGEWPWLTYAEADLLEALGPTSVETRISTVSTDPWTLRAA